MCQIIILFYENTELILTFLMNGFRNIRRIMVLFSIFMNGILTESFLIKTPDSYV